MIKAEILRVFGSGNILCAIGGIMGYLGYPDVDQEMVSKALAAVAVIDGVYGREHENLVLELRNVEARIRQLRDCLTMNEATKPVNCLINTCRANQVEPKFQKHMNWFWSPARLQPYNRTQAEAEAELKTEEHRLSSIEQRLADLAAVQQRLAEMANDMRGIKT